MRQTRVSSGGKPMNCEPHRIGPPNSRGLPGKRPSSQSFAIVDSDGLSSEQRLMLAVLVDAINILKGRSATSGGSKRRAVAEAAHWIAMSGTHYPFTFDSVCAALSLQSKMLRARLSRLARGLGPVRGRLRRQQPDCTRTKRIGDAQGFVGRNMVPSHTGVLLPKDGA